MKESLNQKTTLAEDFRILFGLISIKECRENDLLKEKTEEILEELGEIPKIDGSFDYLFEDDEIKEELSENIDEYSEIGV